MSQLGPDIAEEAWGDTRILYWAARYLQVMVTSWNADIVAPEVVNPDAEEHGHVQVARFKAGSVWHYG
jgi:hypothetical protein